MTNEVGFTNDAILEKLVCESDLSLLKPLERVEIIMRMCKSLNLNPLFRPFEFMVLKGKMTLYATRNCTDQLRKLNKINITKIESKREGDFYHVTAYGEDGLGRQDVATSVLYLKSSKDNRPFVGEELANAFMKAETKAKRRLTLSLCSVGVPDESEVETIKFSKIIEVDHKTGEIINDAANDAPKLASPQQVESLTNLITQLDVKPETINLWLQKENVQEFEQMQADKIDRYIKFCGEKLLANGQ